jgi:hypothetical protein
MVDWDQTFFDERRQRAAGPPEGRERRQFADSHADLSPEAREFAEAVDAYKMAKARKFVTLGELFDVFTSLGYRKA